MSYIYIPSYRTAGRRASRAPLHRERTCQRAIETACPTLARATRRRAPRDRWQRHARVATSNRRCRRSSKRRWRAPTTTLFDAAYVVERPRATDSVSSQQPARSVVRRAQHRCSQTTRHRQSRSTRLSRQLAKPVTIGS